MPNTQPSIAPIRPQLSFSLTAATPLKALELKKAYNNQKSLHLQHKNVEKTLLCFIQDAIEDKCMASLVDECTNLFRDDVPTMIEYLNYNYSKVRYEEVAQKEEEVMSLT